MDIFTGIFALILSAGCFWASVKILRLYYKVKRWQRVNARVISKEVVIHEKFFSADTPYKINAKYAYVLNGVEYSGDKIHLVELLGGQASYMKKDADRRLDKIMGLMSIYVDPKEPINSVMYCEGVVLYYIAFVMGLFALVFGISKLF